jgi:hypothetical protein
MTKASPEGATIATVRTRLQERSGFGRVCRETVGDTLDAMGKKGSGYARAADVRNAARSNASGASI